MNIFREQCLRITVPFMYSCQNEAQVFSHEHNIEHNIEYNSYRSIITALQHAVA